MSGADDDVAYVIHGSATAEEVAAVLVALEAPGGAERPVVAPWLLAARREALGGAPAAEPSDLHAASRR